MADYNSSFTGVEIDANLNLAGTATQPGDLGTASSFNTADLPVSTATQTELDTLDAAVAAITAQDLSALALSKAITMVDGFVYRTANDSDGGLWRERMQGTFWYNETLGTATRGSTRKFPSVAIPMAESSTLTIYNADDPTAPMWKVLDFTGFTITSVAVVNGVVTVGTSTGVVVLDFANDEIDVVLKYTTATTPAIVNNSVAKVAMTVQHDAPVDPSTGLQIPTIYVATAGGISVINNDGTVADSSFTANFYNLDIYNDILSSSRTSNASLLFKADLSGILADGFDLAGLTYKRFSDGSAYPAKSVLGTADNSSQSAGNAYASSLGLTLFAKPESLSALDGTAFVTTTYNSGYMVGDIKGAFLSSTAITSLVDGDTDADRSVNANGLTATSTIDRNPVATGADLVGYSGWSATNFLEQPDNADLDFGTGDFSLIVWVTGGWTYDKIFSRGDGSTAGTELIFYQDNPAGVLRLKVGATLITTPDHGLPYDVWKMYTVVRRSGVVYFYVNKNPLHSASGAGSVTQSGATIRLGIANNTVTHSGDANGWGGMLCNMRLSATAPSAEQIAEIYHDERPLFQPGAQSTIYGASDAVTALAHDKGTDLLHVGTSAGRSVFSGLQRVSNTTVAVPGVISASNDLVIEG